MYNWEQGCSFVSFVFRNFSVGKYTIVLCPTTPESEFVMVKSNIASNAAASCRSNTFKTHSPELYADAASKGAKYFNIRALDFLQMSFEPGVGEKHHILDIGCGTGQFTCEELLPRCLPCERLVATDVSGDMLEYARQHSPHPQIVYDTLDVAGDVSSFVQKYGLFERVYSFFCLNWVKDKETALINISRLMAPGGDCILLFGITGPLLRYWEEIVKMERWKPYTEVSF